MITPNKQINNIYGYVRVSTTEQAINGISIDTQKDLINEFCMTKFNRPVDEFFVDAGVSGTIPINEREESRRLTDTIDEHDIVISTRLDRLSRSSGDLLKTIPIFEETGVIYYLCEQFGDMPISYPKKKNKASLQSKFDMNEMVNKIMVMVLSAVAEIEHGSTVDKLKEGKLAWAPKGYSIGGTAPFGYDKEEEKIKTGKRVKRRMKLVENEEEQKVLQFIYKLRKKGLGARRISKQIVAHFPEYDIFPYWKVRNILARKAQGLHNAS
jgi:DNA invertase Pin-like site-specific DNA recombinase|tara:strand:- start:263 stop:1066 length:804 start_codon:yes stop_codon:yes gene_type:complete